MVSALTEELDIRAIAGDMNEVVQTIYFGGGTPSLLSPTNIEKLIVKIRQHWNVDPEAEITMEANPENVDKHSCEEWKKTGINRLSLGIQSIYDDELTWMNRSHDAASSDRAIEQIRKAGFDNFSVDLIYGSPLLSDDKWDETLEWVKKRRPPHLSCYALTVEPRTPLENHIRTKRTAPIDQERVAHHFEKLMSFASETDYEHYEISNFAQPGYHSRHNSSYWHGRPYLGIGPSAHSYDGRSRQWNVSNNKEYIRSIQNGKIPCEREILGLIQQFNETIMIRLRLAEGIDLKTIFSDFGQEKVDRLLKQAEKHLSKKHLERIEDRLLLTREGKLFADGIAADLFLD